MNKYLEWATKVEQFSAAAQEIVRIVDDFPGAVLVKAVQSRLTPSAVDLLILTRPGDAGDLQEKLRLNRGVLAASFSGAGDVIATVTRDMAASIEEITGNTLGTGPGGEIQ